MSPGSGAGERDPVRDGFEREFQLARGLNHPHTVRVLSWHDGDRPAYAMQYIDGTDFADLVNRPFTVWAPVLLVITDTLVYWHRKGVVHGDVKPSNLLLDRRGVAYLADFGSAATVHGDSNTGRGGSAAYASPEQQDGQSPDPADDVFAMARVIAELATGDPATAPLSDLYRCRSLPAVSVRVPSPSGLRRSCCLACCSRKACVGWDPTRRRPRPMRRPWLTRKTLRRPARPMVKHRRLTATVGLMLKPPKKKLRPPKKIAWHSVDRQMSPCRACCLSSMSWNAVASRSGVVLDTFGAVGVLQKVAAVTWPAAARSAIWAL